MDLVLAFCNLEDHISDSQAPLDPNEVEEWKKRDARAKADIGFSFSYKHVEHVRRPESGYDMWIEVMNRFQGERCSTAKLLCTFSTVLKMSDGECSLAYLTRIRQVDADLKAMDGTIIAQELFMTILCSL